MGVSEIGFPQNVVYKQRIQTSDTLPVTIGASKYCEFLFDIDAGDRMTPLGIVGWGCNDKTQVFLLDFYMDNDLQTAKLILKNPYATTIAISSLYIDVLYSKQGLDMSEVDVVDNLTTESAVAALSAKQGKVLNDSLNILLDSLVPNVDLSSNNNNWGVYNCTGTTRWLPAIYTNADRTVIQMQGRLQINDFVRTGGNPGVVLHTGVNFRRGVVVTVGVRYTSDMIVRPEVFTATIHAEGDIYISTTESTNNAANGSLTGLFPITTIFL